jgi:hypothetical protein
MKRLLVALALAVPLAAGTGAPVLASAVSVGSGHVVQQDGGNEWG